MANVLEWLLLAGILFCFGPLLVVLAIELAKVWAELFQAASRWWRAR